jgi:hypothetical protein
MVHGYKAVQIFGWQLLAFLKAESLALTNSGGICGHETIPVPAAPRLLNILHMGLMSDAAEWCWCWLLMVHGYKAMPIFILWLDESLAVALMNKSGQKVMVFVVMKPYQLPPDP